MAGDKEVPNSINRTIFGIETHLHSILQGFDFRLSIEPFLELKRVCSGLPVSKGCAINRTIFGIETLKLSQFARTASSYQSNHFWN